MTIVVRSQPRVSGQGIILMCGRRSCRHVSCKLCGAACHHTTLLPDSWVLSQDAGFPSLPSRLGRPPRRMLSGVMLSLLSISPHAHTDYIIVYEQVFGIKLHSAIPRRKRRIILPPSPVISPRPIFRRMWMASPLHEIPIGKSAPTLWLSKKRMSGVGISGFAEMHDGQARER